jgi:hypothetical protein
LLTVCCVFFQGKDVNARSKCFTEEWVEKLYRGINRNLEDFRFICLTDKKYNFIEDIIQVPLEHNLHAYMPIMEIFKHDFGRVLFMGLDSVITGSLEDLASYQGDFAMIRDPNHPNKGASGVMSFPYRPDIWEKFITSGTSERYDQRFLHEIPHKYLDDYFPGQLASYKCHIKTNEINDERIIYFHGAEKPHEVEENFIKENWV